MQLDLGSILALGLIAGLFLLGWRANRAPGADRALLKEHSQLKGRISALEEGFKGCATRADVAALSGKIDALEEHTASSGEMNALEGKINVIGERVDGVKEMMHDTRESVKVIERLLMKGRLGE